MQYLAIPPSFCVHIKSLTHKNVHLIDIKLLNYVYNGFAITKNHILEKLL